MSRSQWGHGYYKGVESALKNPTGLVGMFVHIRDENGKIEYQLMVEKSLPDSMFMLRYFSFADGRATESKIFTLEEMRDFSFYATDKDMRRAWHEENADWVKGTFEENERMLAALNGWK